jgi:hypothetical protein
MVLAGSWVKISGRLFTAVLFADKNGFYYPKQNAADGLYGRHATKVAIKRGNKRELTLICGIGHGPEVRCLKNQT